MENVVPNHAKQHCSVVQKDAISFFDLLTCLTLVITFYSVADPGCLSRILIFTHPGSRIPDLGSRIQKQQQKTGVKKKFL
jgi:hypothetical protein